jgi:hypothetical protein
MSADISPPKTVSVWDFKPWWCQPWSIVLTGVGAIAISWLVFHRFWLTGLVAVPMLSWMGFFLLVFPKAAADSGMLAEMQRGAADSGTGTASRPNAVD